MNGGFIFWCWVGVGVVEDVCVGWEFVYFSFFKTACRDQKLRDVGINELRSYPLGSFLRDKICCPNSPPPVLE